MIHPQTELRFINPEIGFGVFATAPIPRGTVVWLLCHLDIVLTRAERQALPAPYQPILDTYAFIGAGDQHVLCWDHGRSVNHSCEPAMRSLGPEMEIAVRDIAANEQLTCEYGGLNLPYRLSCMCGSARCRGTIGPDDVIERWRDWDDEVARSLALAARVPQPLLPFARNPQPIWDWADGRAPLPSHRTYHADASREASLEPR